jgi:REP element-mobilizing transposase RayT
MPDMASRNEVKEDLPDSTFHVYNRGVEYRQIFMDGFDYRRFINQLRAALQEEPSVTLLVYCLMPDHFHLMLQQTDSGAVSRVMHRLGIAYVRYFNHKYRRVGTLYQGRYKARRIVGAKDMMDTSAYIHLNPERAGLGWRQQAYSSVKYYRPPFKADGFVNPWPVLTLFDFPSDYSGFLSTRQLRLPPKTSTR